jgi:hypothetical protein
MKKFLTLSLLLASAAIFVPSAAEAKTNEASSNAALEASAVEPQTRRQRRRWNRRVRVVNRVRIVRRGYRTYREVWQYRYRPNGRVTARLISRVRIR